MEARKLIAKLQSLLEKGVEVSLAQGMFVLQFSDKMIKIADLNEIAKEAERAEKSDMPLLFGKTSTSRS